MITTAAVIAPPMIPLDEDFDWNGGILANLDVASENKACDIKNTFVECKFVNNFSGTKS